MQGTCIYCAAKGDMSREHTVPEGLGNFGDAQLLHGRVCTTCNNAIGEETETQFCRTGPNGFLRWLIGVEGKDGRPPSPFYRGAAGAPPVYIYGRACGFEFDMLWESAWAGVSDVFPARQIVFRDESRGFVPVAILDRMLASAEELRRELENQGIPDARAFRAWATPEELPQIEALIRALGQEPPAEWLTTALPEGRIALRAQVQVDDRYFRAIAKAVFHHMLTVLTDLTGGESAFQSLRDYIRHGQGSGFVRELPYQFIGNYARGERPASWSHIIAIERSFLRTTGYAQFFTGPQALPLPYRVELGRNPARIALRLERHAHAFVIDNAGYGDPRGHVEDLRPSAFNIVLR